MKRVLTWSNGLQVGTGLLGLGGNYTTWRRLPGDIPNSLVWNSIRSTQPVYEGTVIPRSFELTTPYGRFWVHGNATKHFFEYAYHLSKRGLSPESVNLTSQVHLASFHAAVTEAAKRGIRYNETMVIGDWELKFALPREPSQLPAIIHARYRFGR